MGDERMNPPYQCPDCGAPLPEAGAVCMRCLLAVGLEAGDQPRVGPGFLDDLPPSSFADKQDANIPGPEPPPAMPTETEPPPVTITEQIGEQIGRYKLLERIGEGGFGMVYLAEQSAPLKRLVALKVIKLGMDTREVIARFEAERQALALMDHPNIAKVLDAGTTDRGRPFFVMEFVRGTKITTYCDQNNLSTRQRLELFTRVCQAVQHAHQKGIIHRDIKPSNILVSVHDGEAVPKVIDFGIAKATAGQALTDRTVFTAFDQFIGTPAYVSPEQAGMSPDASGDIDTRSDIYSLGVLLYELMTGRTPFEPKELIAVGFDRMRQMIREQEPPRPSTRLSTMKQEDLTSVARCRQVEIAQLLHLLRRDLDWIVMKCLEKDRNRRYESASGLGEDIHRYLNSEPVVACPPSAFYRMRKLARRYRHAVISAAAIALTLVAGICVSTWQAVQATRAERQQRLLNEELVRVNSQAVARTVDGLFQFDQSLRALPLLATQLRRNPQDTLAARRLISALSCRDWALPMARFGPHPQNAIYARSTRDGKHIVTVDDAANLRVWDPATGRPTTDFFKHTALMSGVEFSPSGRLLVGLGDDGSLALWDASTGQPVLPGKLPKTRLSSAALSPDEQFLATCDGLEGVRLWRLPDGEPAGGLPQTNGVLLLDFAQEAGNPWLATFTVNGTAEVWDLSTRLQVCPPMPHTNEPILLNLSRDGRRLMTVTRGSRGDAVYLWTIPSGKLLWEFQVGDPVMQAKLSPDARRIGVYVMAAKTYCLVLDAETGKKLFTSEPYTRLPSHLPFSTDSAHVLFAPQDGTDLRVHDATAGQPLTEPIPPAGLLMDHASFSPDGRFLVCGHSPEALLYAVRKGQKPIQTETSTKAGIEFSPDGATALMESKDHTIRLHSVPALQPIGPPLASAASVSRLAMDHAGQRCALSFTNGDVSILNIRTGERLLGPLSYETNALKLAFTRDGTRLLEYAGDNTLHLWDLRNGSRSFPGIVLKATSDKGYGTRVPALQPSPDDRLVAVSFSSSAQVWDLGTGKCLAEVCHDGPVIELAFSPDSRLVASASMDGTGRIWEARTGREPTPPLRHHDSVMSVSFSRDGQRVLTASADGTACLWRVTDGAQAAKTWGNVERLYAARFSPDSTLFVTGTFDGHVRLWDAATGLPVSESRRANEEGKATYAGFSPDGRYVVCSARTLPARLGEVPALPSSVPEWLPALAEALAGSRQLPDGRVESVSPTRLLELRLQLLKLPGDDFYTRWGRWFADPAAASMHLF